MPEAGVTIAGGTPAPATVRPEDGRAHLGGGGAVGTGLPGGAHPLGLPPHVLNPLRAAWAPSRRSPRSSGSIPTRLARTGPRWDGSRVRTAGQGLRGMRLLGGLWSTPPDSPGNPPHTTRLSLRRKTISFHKKGSLAWCLEIPRLKIVL